jgi:hypothetical protein
MFNSQTLFIVGAGASCEVKLPAGIDLKRQIRSKLNFEFEHEGLYFPTSGDNEIFEALRLTT